MTTVSVHSYTHSVTYVADNIHKSFKDIIRLSGLDPAKLMESRESTLRAMQTWIQSQDLTGVVLEIFDPITDKLIVRWDLDISYEWSADDGSFYTDTEQLKYHIKKAGVTPAYANYRLLFMLKPGAPEVAGWGAAASRSIDGMVKQSLGSTLQHSGLGASTGYWRAT